MHQILVTRWSFLSYNISTQKFLDSSIIHKKSYTLKIDMFSISLYVTVCCGRTETTLPCMFCWGTMDMYCGEWILIPSGDVALCILFFPNSIKIIINNYFLKKIAMWSIVTSNTPLKINFKFDLHIKKGQIQV